MGTRSLIAVYAGDEYKVAQYSQWDGYPEGQGLEILRFLRDKLDESLFLDELNKLRWIDEEKLRKLRERFGQDEDGYMKWQDHDRFSAAFPEFSRDTGAEILEMIQGGNVLSGMLENSLEFAADSLFCEWAYVVDFDHGVFEVYRGFSNVPLGPGDRFYWLEGKGGSRGYHPVRLAASFKLDALKDLTDESFVAEFSDAEDE